MIDGEKLVRGYLLQHPAVAALGIEIVGQPPPKTSTRGWIRLTQLDAPSVNGNSPGHLYEFYFQLDCYASQQGIGGSQQREAVQIAGTVHDALAELNRKNYQANGVTVAGSNPNMGPRIPDTDFEPARERFASTLTLWAHA